MAPHDLRKAEKEVNLKTVDKTPLRVIEYLYTFSTFTSRKLSSLPDVTSSVDARRTRIRVAQSPRE